MARGANPENLHLGTGTGGVQLIGPPAVPCKSCQTKVVMGSLMPLEVHLVGVKMMGVSLRTHILTLILTYAQPS